MIIPAATIWDTKVQSVCAAIAAYDAEGGIELWMCGNFGQVSFQPPRVLINPNRLYPIDEAIQATKRFSINIFAASQLDAARRLFRVRRRSPVKQLVFGIPVIRHPQHETPYLEDCLATLFCRSERWFPSGDHRLVLAQIAETITSGRHAGERPLLYPELPLIALPRRVLQAVKAVLTATGAEEFARRKLDRRRGNQTPDLPGNTYWQGGATEKEISTIASYGLVDKGRICWPPASPPAVINRRIGVCVAGVGKWGSFHCQLFRQASPHVQLFVCGRDPERTQHVARRTGADGYIIGWEKAVLDQRVQAISLVLPHDLHAAAAQAAAEAGKHVLVEKPIATTLEQADLMIEAARRAGTILMVAENMHFRPPVREAVRAIEAGAIGEPLFLQIHGGGVLRPSGWQADSARMGGGILMDLGIHYVRVLRLLMGEPDLVHAFPGMQIHTKMSGEDNVQAVFASARGWRANCYLNWAGPTGNGPDAIVSGEHGVLFLWRQERHIDLYPAEPSEFRSLLDHVRPAALAHLLARFDTGCVRIPLPDEDLSGYGTQVREFLAAVAAGRQPVTPAADGRRDLEIVLAAYSALHSGAAERIPPAPPRAPAADLWHS